MSDSLGINTIFAQENSSNRTELISFYQSFTITQMIDYTNVLCSYDFQIPLICCAFRAAGNTDSYVPIDNVQYQIGSANISGKIISSSSPVQLTVPFIAVLNAAHTKLEVRINFPGSSYAPDYTLWNNNSQTVYIGGFFKCVYNSNSILIN